MASLVIDTGVESHPQISIDALDLKSGLIIFHWVGGPHGGDCAEQFELTLEDHGEMTVNEMVEAITTAMIAKLPEQGEQP